MKRPIEKRGVSKTPPIHSKENVRTQIRTPDEQINTCVTIGEPPAQQRSAGKTIPSKRTKVHKNQPSQALKPCSPEIRDELEKRLKEAQEVLECLSSDILLLESELEEKNAVQSCAFETQLLAPYEDGSCCSPQNDSLNNTNLIRQCRKASAEIAKEITDLTEKLKALGEPNNDFEIETLQEPGDPIAEQNTPKIITQKNASVKKPMIYAPRSRLNLRARLVKLEKQLHELNSEKSFQKETFRQVYPSPPAELQEYADFRSGVIEEELTLVNRQIETVKNLLESNSCANGNNACSS